MGRVPEPRSTGFGWLVGEERICVKGLLSRALVGGSRPGHKVMTLMHAIVAGGSHIDHRYVLRCTEQVLAFRVMAPSTLGTFLRAFTFGHVRQLEAVVPGGSLTRPWPGSDAAERPVRS